MRLDIHNNEGELYEQLYVEVKPGMIKQLKQIPHKLPRNKAGMMLRDVVREMVIAAEAILTDGEGRAD